MVDFTMPVEYSACLFADGRNRFYRSYLSILMQELAPVEIIVAYENSENLNSMRIAQLAAEDDSSVAVPTTYQEIKKTKELGIREICAETKFIAPLIEGDFWLPSKNLEQAAKVNSITSIISSSYYQRLKLGNSKIVNQSNKLHFSTLFLEKHDFYSERCKSEKVFLINNSLAVVMAFNANHFKQTIEN